MVLGGPYLDVTLASRRGQARREQVPGEDPLDRILGADMECHADGVRVAGGVAEAVAALFIIQPNLCLVVSRNAGLHQNCTTTSLLTFRHYRNANPGSGLLV